MKNDRELADTLAELDAELEARMNAPHPDFAEPLAPGSNVSYLPREEHDRVIAEIGGIIRGMAAFGRRMSEHEHRLALERSARRQ